MTGYGSAKRRTAAGECAVEIHAVNRKMLDIVVQLPKEFLFLDLDLRKWIQEAVERGQVTVRLAFEAADATFLLPALRSLKARWEEIARGTGYSPSVVDFPFLMGQVERLPVEAAELKDEVKKTVQEALKEFIAMRQREGIALTKDIKDRLVAIETVLKKIEKKVPVANSRYRKKLQQKMREVADDDRLVREVAILVDKVDVTEEITRLYSHLEQFRALMHEKKGAVGRTLDFLTQEMGREINTLAAKAVESGTVKMAVVIKSEIEKVREQVQNIE